MKLLNSLNKLTIIHLVTSIRGGSKFFQSLLENHPDVICFPRVFRYSQFLNKVESQIHNTGYLSDIFIESYPRFFNGNIWHKFNKLDKANMLGDNKDDSFLVDANLFKEYFIIAYEESEKSTRNLFLALHEAFHKAKGLSISDKPFILYHPHDITYIEDLNICVQDFGVENIKVVFAIRDIIDGLNSTVKKYEFQNSLNPLNFYYKEVFLFTLPISNTHPLIDLRVAPLEITRSHRKESLKELCRWTELPWNDCLLNSTLMGKKWLGNAQKNKGDIKYLLKWHYPNGWLERKDKKNYNTLFPERGKLFGSVFMEKFENPIVFRIMLLLPLKQEVEIFKKSISIFYWFKSINRSIHEASSKDFLYNQKIKGKNNKYQHLISNLYAGNIITCFVNYIRRVFFSFSLLSMDFSKEKIQLLYTPKTFK